MISLGVVLAAVWLVWSGHFDNPFLLLLGGLSVLFTLATVRRMNIADEETAPTFFGLRPLFYLPYLIKEIAQSNWAVSRTVLSSRMKLRRNLLTVPSHQRTEVGRVVYANSITLTPGTVSIRVDGDRVLVHALSFEGAEEDLSGEMDRRVSEMEGSAAEAIGGRPDGKTPGRTGGTA